MGKQSRRQRKQLRGKQGPVLPSAGRLPAEPSHVVPAPSRTITSRSVSGSPGGAPTRVDWSSWPTSVKLVMAGILVLVAIGLYRRFTEASASDNVPPPDVSGVIPSGEASPSSPAQLPTASSAAPESN